MSIGLIIIIFLIFFSQLPPGVTEFYIEVYDEVNQIVPREFTILSRFSILINTKIFLLFFLLGRSCVSIIEWCRNLNFDFSLSKFMRESPRKDLMGLNVDRNSKSENITILHKSISVDNLPVRSV